MPKIVNERTTRITNVQDLEDFAMSCDHARIMSAHAPNGDETRFQLVQNAQTGDYVSAMGGQYELVQHETVVLELVNAIKENGHSITSGFIKQTPNRFRAVVEFKEEVFFGDDPSPHKLGAVIRNSFDGSTSVEASLFLMRGFCMNGMVFGRQDLLGGKMKHNSTVHAKLTEGFSDYFKQLDAVLAPWSIKLVKAQGVVFSSEDELVKVLNKANAGKKLTAHAIERLPEYVKEFGVTSYAAYQAMTDAITHHRNGQGDGLNGAATDRAHAKAEGILVAVPSN